MVCHKNTPCYIIWRRVRGKQTVDDIPLLTIIIIVVMMCTLGCFDRTQSKIRVLFIANINECAVSLSDREVSREEKLYYLFYFEYRLPNHYYIFLRALGGSKRIITALS